MQLKNLILAASAAATVSALPTAQAENASEKTFGIVSIHSGSAVQYASFNAAKSSLFAGLSSQNASCARPQEQTATFYIKDGALYLYDQSATPQEFYVDRSGMGKFISHFQYPFYYIQSQRMLMYIQAKEKSATPPAPNPHPRTRSAPAGPSTTRTTSSSVAVI